MARRRFDLLGLAVALFGFFVPYLRSTVAPVHDTALFFEYFHYFYSSFYTGQGIPHWLPYEAYGVQSDIAQLDFISPANYLMAIVGRLLRVDDVLILFKASVFLECLTLLLGVYLLSSLWFRDRATRVLVCLSTIGSTVWYAQIHFNLRFYYLFPLVLYFLARFLHEARVRWLTAAALTGLAWLLGARAYYAILWMFAGLIICLVLMPLAARACRRLDRRQFAGLAASVTLVSILAGSYAYLVERGREHVTVQAPERDAVGRVTLQTFLTYGGTLDKRAAVRRLITGFPTHLENGSGKEESIYCGLPIVFFFLLAFVTVNDIWFSAVATTLLALVALSFSGLFARLVYLLPAMSFYRHITIVYGFVKILLILAAGFGIDRFWELSPERRALLFWTCTAVCGAVAAGLADGMMLARVAVYAAAGGVGLAWGRQNLQLLKAGLATALLVDLALFQSAVFAEVPRLSDSQQAIVASTRVRPPVWQATRARGPESHEAAAALSWATRPDMLAVYGGIYTYSSFDSCAPAMRLDFKSSGVEQFTDRLVAAEAESHPLVGCGVPKLRVVDGDGQVDGQAVRFEEGQFTDSTGSAADDPEIIEFTANTMAARVNNRSPGESWLVYTDAYHPGWRATINQQPTPLYAAFDAFKAVRLRPGVNVVRMEFRRPLADFIDRCVVLFGAAFALLMVWWWGLTVWREAEGYNVMNAR